jgi:prolyl 4-hydroxylase
MKQNSLKNISSGWIKTLIILSVVSIIILLVYKKIYQKEDFQMQLNEFIEKYKSIKIINEPLEFSYHYNLLSRKEANEIIKWARPRIRPSKIAFDLTRQIRELRNNSNTWVDLDKFKSTQRIASYLSKYIDLPQSHFESFQIVHYKPGQKYDYHYDICRDPKNKECVKSLNEHISGIRRYTFFIYLNDVEKGGETDFKHAGFKVKPECGKAILWKNTFNKGNVEMTNLNALHAGLPPTKGEKWAMNIWIRSKPYRHDQQ